LIETCTIWSLSKYSNGFKASIFLSTGVLDEKGIKKPTNKILLFLFNAYEGVSSNILLCYKDKKKQLIWWLRVTLCIVCTFIVRKTVTRMPKSSCTLEQNQELKKWEYFERRNIEVQGWGLPMTIIFCIEHHLLVLFDSRFRKEKKLFVT
jgi:hypothetical protein